MKILLTFLALSASAATLPPAPTPAEKRIGDAHKQLEKTPGHFQFYNALGAAYLQRSRETEDASYIDRAEEAIAKSLALQKDNFEALRVRSTIYLARHEFQKARELAASLHKRNMDDLIVRGVLTDTAIELGDYDAAADEAQWMLDLRRSDPRCLERGARLREIFGNTTGAAELWGAAFRQTLDQETEERAWILVNVARLDLATGQTQPAEAAVTQALALFPGYPLAITALAEVKLAQKKPAEAAEQLHTKQHLTLHDEFLLSQPSFERDAVASIDKPTNANRDLVFCYLAREGKAAEALRIARLEASHRSDIDTLDALACALHANNQDTEARQVIDKILALGIKDDRILAHSKQIESQKHS